ncbi:MAG: hypothetical protein NTV46_01915 [Verrucomicrobia bacterium]|nr:hypothetical protein [Verrucomicrobiota bacterium]
MPHNATAAQAAELTPARFAAAIRSDASKPPDQPPPTKSRLWPWG